MSDTPTHEGQQVRDAEWLEIDPPKCDLVLLFKSYVLGTFYYQGLRTGHVYRWEHLRNKWWYAK